MHERQYLESDLRRLEGYTILLDKEPFKNDKYFMMDVKDMTREIIKGKTNTFTSVNKNVLNAIADLFDALFKKYQSQLKILEAIYGKMEMVTQ